MTSFNDKKFIRNQINSWIDTDWTCADVQLLAWKIWMKWINFEMSEKLNWCKKNQYKHEKYLKRNKNYSWFYSTIIIKILIRTIFLILHNQNYEKWRKQDQSKNWIYLLLNYIILCLMQFENIKFINTILHVQRKFNSWSSVEIIFIDWYKFWCWQYS